MLRLRSLSAAMAAGLVALAAPHHDAWACGGGMFTPDAQSQTVAADGHRVVISMSPDQTVLWDQISYHGAPEDFAWVMPVKSGATADVASPAWLEVLDAATTTTITSPELVCGSSDSSDSGGCACGGAAGGDKGNFGDPQGDTSVTVVHEGTIGPYMSVTIKSGTPGAIAKWLTDNGYKIPADVAPILDDYTQQGMDFIALRLKPGQGVADMQPIRVVTPGLADTFPMRMLKAGASGKVALKLFVIGEGRVEPKALNGGALDLKALTWDFGAEKSNYDDLRSQALAANGGKTWITTYSKKGTLLSRIQDVIPNYRVGEKTETTIADAYYDQALANKEVTTTCAGMIFDSDATSTSKVVDLCPDGQNCGMLGPNEIDSRKFTCDSAKDLSVALVGLHPANVVVTRLEAELPTDALDADLTLSASADQSPVENMIKAKNGKNQEADCTVASAAAPLSPASRPPRQRGIVAMTITLAAAVLALARRSRRQRPSLAPARAG